MINLKTFATHVVGKLREHDAGGTEHAQVLCVAEEAGEFVGAMRRWRGLARRPGTEQEAQAELADLVITAYVMAEVLGWDMDQIVAAKAEIVLNRGWKEGQDDA